MTPATPFLEALQAAAERAAAEEAAFRRQSGARIKALERDRGHAFRRLNLMKAVAPIAARAESEELAVANALVVLRSKLGWDADDEARAAVLSQFAPVAKAIFAQTQPESADVDVPAALAAFETWYAETHGVAFLELFDRPIPETPLVDF